MKKNLFNIPPGFSEPVLFESVQVSSLEKEVETLRQKSQETASNPTGLLAPYVTAVPTFEDEDYRSGVASPQQQKRNVLNLQDIYKDTPDLFGPEEEMEDSEEEEGEEEGTTGKTEKEVKGIQIN